MRSMKRVPRTPLLPTRRKGFNLTSSAQSEGHWVKYLRSKENCSFLSCTVQLGRLRAQEQKSERLLILLSKAPGRFTTQHVSSLVQSTKLGHGICDGRNEGGEDHLAKCGCGLSSKSCCRLKSDPPEVHQLTKARQGTMAETITQTQKMRSVAFVG